jgi:zinc transport system substrate-binding protein
MSHPSSATPALLAALLLAVSACAPDQLAGDAASPAAARQAGGGVHIVTSVFALASLAQRVAPGAQVELLSVGGGDPHAMALTAGQRAAIAEADVVLHTGDIGFQPHVEQAVAAADGEVVSITEEVSHDALRQLATGDGHDALDPHVWLSPSHMTGVARAIAAATKAAGGAPGKALTDNAATLAGELTALEGEIERLLTGCAHRTALVDHEAWGYLLAPRGVTQRGISGAGGHGRAGPRRLAELADLIESQQLPGVFAQAGQARGSAAALAAEADVTRFEVDPLVIPDDPDAWLRRGYQKLLTAQAATFADGLACRP